jgi:hypothetical protein
MKPIAYKFVFSFLGATTILVSNSWHASAQYMGADNPVGIPRFLFRDGTDLSAGKAFGIAWFNRRKLLLCPIHLLGPSGGYAIQLDGKEVADKILSVEIFDLKNENVIAKAGRGVLRTGSTKDESDNYADDMTAFELESNSRMPLLALCPHSSPVGTPVWVLSKDTGGSSLQADRYPGKITEFADDRIVVQLDRRLTAMGSSGAPIVNA